MSAPLERLQVIKGWVQEGEKKEKVYDVACASGSLTKSHRCDLMSVEPDVATCEHADGKALLSAIWQDPEFDQSEESFYYVRALEVKTCRWSTWDALRANKPSNPKLPKFLQERAWSSPIWVLRKSPE
tara:strand:- start:494 stop:877 length:384 start_codon:yes stop_codon:yes gene_type:complete